MAPLQKSRVHHAEDASEPTQLTAVRSNIHKATESSEEDDEVDNEVMTFGEPESSEGDSLDSYLKTLKKYKAPVKTGLRGINVIHDPLYNKGTSFPRVERDRLGLRGLVPPRRLTVEAQLDKMYAIFSKEEDPLRKSRLTDLHDRNETLYFRLMIKHMKEMAPIVYTPTVGLVCQKFGYLFRRPRGMFFSTHDRGQFGAMVYNWPCDDVEVIVVTDGSRILGLGDLGANGMGIPIGKLALYTAAGGIDPRKVLPVMLDTGTNNKKLLEDPYYLGVQHPRVTGQTFWSMVDEFMGAVRSRWPKVLVQFEDFSSDHAADVLNAYRLKQLCFNDDIQGTGATVLAGVLCACDQVQIPLKDQRIVILGAGSAGLGVAATLLQGMVREGMTTEEARDHFYLLDQFGLIGEGRKGLNSAQQFFSRKGDLADKTQLFEVIKHVKPTLLMGLSGAAGAFTQEAVEEMAKHTEHPIVFPLSNPTSVAECTAQQAYEWTKAKCVFASGSPFPPVVYNGVEYQISQCNNMFIFPGVGLAASVIQATRVTDGMLYSAAKALSRCLSADEVANGQVFPSVENIRDVSLKIATAVCETAFEEGVAGFLPTISHGATLENYVASKMYYPSYHALVE
ncbi:NADP-dependent malic enzyme [Phytophthora fragariae]|uniref:NADP-dependent malic enzyme n=1 Tax=Phytophthora fragariae TaxID=53985 RepID=A0A6A3K406_9STRA|nr:NADP-dependent malic enzyme [Phytophthora fragariae]KAE9297833.1 NADP-dependent malic enzyme [Phytophthora fragariae]